MVLERICDGIPQGEPRIEEVIVNRNHPVGADDEIARTGQGKQLRRMRHQQLLNELARGRVLREHNAVDD
jgi:hypothetical protein